MHILLRRSVRQTLLIVGVGSLLGFLSNALGNADPWGIRWIRRPVVPPPALPTPEQPGGPASRTEDIQSAEVRTVELEHVKQLYDDRGALFIDARHPFLADQGMIPGAVNVPWEELEYYQSALDSIPKDTTIVTYCDGQGCELSVHLAEELTTRGYENVLVFYSGWVDWVDAGYPVEIPEAAR